MAFLYVTEAIISIRNERPLYGFGYDIRSIRLPDKKGKRYFASSKGPVSRFEMSSVFETVYGTMVNADVRTIIAKVDDTVVCRHARHCMKRLLSDGWSIAEIQCVLRERRRMIKNVYDISKLPYGIDCLFEFICNFGEPEVVRMAVKSFRSFSGRP